MGNYDNWEEAKAGQNGTPMPYLVLPAQLRALRYLQPDGSTLPGRLRELLRGVELEWYADGQEPSQWWKGAQLSDPRWREEHMRPPPRYKGGQVDADELLALMRTAFSEGIPDHSVTSGEASGASKNPVHLNSASSSKQKDSAVIDGAADAQKQGRVTLEMLAGQGSRVNAHMHSMVDAGETGSDNATSSSLKHQHSIVPDRSFHGATHLPNIRARKRDGAPGINPVPKHTRTGISRGKQGQGLGVEIPSINKNPENELDTYIRSAAGLANRELQAPPAPAPGLPGLGYATEEDSMTI
jgi:hypothetical protein